MSEVAFLLRCAALLLLLALCHVIGACVVAPRDVTPGLGVTISTSVTGLCLVSFLFLLTKLLGSTVLVVVVASICLALLYWYRRPRTVFPLEYRATHLVCALAVIIVGVLPTAIMGIRGSDTF